VAGRHLLRHRRLLRRDHRLGARYALFSVDQAWGDDPDAFLFGDFLQVGTRASASTSSPASSCRSRWSGVVLGDHAPRGAARVGATSVVFIPVLMLVTFLALVVRALFLPGAAVGSTPCSPRLGGPGRHVGLGGRLRPDLLLAVGRLRHHDHLRVVRGRRTDMTGSGLVVGLSNSGFELLAGIGVFAALGFMARPRVAVDEVATEGLGLAFVAFPAIINEAPAGALIGVLFFGSPGAGRAHLAGQRHRGHHLLLDRVAR
jgi:neurotransmitter:Na+ symporter, NSS family